MPRSRKPLRLILAAGGLGAALSLGVAGQAFAAPGDNGDVKIHKDTTLVSDERNNPKVCTFYLDAFHFDTVQSVSWTIHQQHPTGTALVLSGSITLTNGTGHTGDLNLPNGHYKLEWTFKGEHGAAKHKVFKVDCPSPGGGPSTPPGHPPTPPAGHGGPPSGGVSAGAGGSFHGPNAAETLAGTALAAAGLALGGRRLLRRRSAK